MRAVAIGLVALGLTAAPAVGRTVAVESAEGTAIASLRVERTVAVKGTKYVTAQASWDAVQALDGVTGPSVNPDVQGSLSLVCGTSWQKRTFKKSARIVVPPKSKRCTIGVAFSVFQLSAYPAEPVSTTIQVTLGTT